MSGCAAERDWKRTRGAVTGPDVPRIIEFLDDHLQRTGKPHLTPPEANQLLEEAGLLDDRPSRSGLPLRRLLRDGLIPHAYQPSGKYGRWFIPHSSSQNQIDHQEST